MTNYEKATEIAMTAGVSVLTVGFIYYFIQLRDKKILDSKIRI